MDDEEDIIGGMAGAPQDILSQLAVLQGDQAKQQERARALRQQMLEQSIEALRQRRYGPSMSEQLFALSAAFAQPTRHKGLGPVLANVMPVLAQTTAASRQGKMAQEDALMELQNRYALQGSADESDAIKSRIAMLKVAASANKPEKPREWVDPEGRGVVRSQDGKVSLVPFGDAEGDELPVLTPDEARKAPPGTVFKTQDGRVMRVPGGKGGPTGSAPSGGF